ncbi:MptD family putative ECF transporter S component [Anoxybacterium hadale]|uniref:MptD family putative ECF transporter S component n=1 Tax=Anoxybacterium hadale TaxID=3408580 RepID=A0ACD1AJ70_9FIRM|nr:MptD family putative ECF transporter S component [Clostridiales bacterium]
MNAKDLINVGIFTAIYFVIFFVTGMVGYIPVMMLAIPFLCPLTAGVPFMLFLTRVRKFGMVTIMGILLAILMLVFGHPWPCIITGIVFPLAGDLILRNGNFKSWSSILLGYAVFSQWITGLMIPFYFMRETYFKSLRSGYGDTYADTLMAITPTWAFGVVVLAAAAGSVLGAYFGKSLLKKHFKRAGIA